MKYIYIGHDDFLMERGVNIGESYEGNDFGGKSILIYYYNSNIQHYTSAPCKRTCLVIDPEEDISDEFTLL